MQLSFKNLPFIPDPGQVIYVESSYNKKLNNFIRENYEWIQSEFKRKGLTFCFFPLLAEEVMRYNAPYVSEDKIKTRAEGVPSLANFAVTSEPIGPSLFFAIDVPVVDQYGNTVLQYVQIETHWYKSTKSTFTEVVEQVKVQQRTVSLYYQRLRKERERQERLAREEVLRRQKEEEERKRREVTGQLPEEQEEEPTIRFSVVHRSVTDEDQKEETTTRFSFVPSPSSTDETDNCCCESSTQFSSVPKRKRFLASGFRDSIEFSIGPAPNPDKADEDFIIESQKLIDEIKERVNALKHMGVNTLFLRELMDEQPMLSRLHITKDYRIFLVDYNELEIQMSLLPKAVFILFLRHPEGIRFKELSDYTQELLNIYLALGPNGTSESHHRSIRDITDSTKNSINEKCARIREAFVNHFDERLAQYYFVTGKRGEPKRITLNRDLVIWD